MTRIADILGVPPGLEGLHDVVMKEQMRHDAFRNLLRHVLKDYPTSHNNFGTIVNLGCRSGSDTDDIDTVFSERGQTYQHIAIDCDSREIDYAKTAHPSPHTTYIDDNAADPTVKKHYPPYIDLVLLRHPEIFTGNEDIWFDMVLHAWSRTHDRSQILITLYNDKEYQLIQKTFARLPNSKITEVGINPLRNSELTQWNHRTDTLNCPDHFLVRLKKDDCK